MSLSRFFQTDTLPKPLGVSLRERNIYYKMTRALAAQPPLDPGVPGAGSFPGARSPVGCGGADTGHSRGHGTGGERGRGHGPTRRLGVHGETTAAAALRGSMGPVARAHAPRRGSPSAIYKSTKRAFHQYAPGYEMPPPPLHRFPPNLNRDVKKGPEFRVQIPSFFHSLIPRLPQNVEKENPWHFPSLF